MRPRRTRPAPATGWRRSRRARARGPGRPAAGSRRLARPGGASPRRRRERATRRQVAAASSTAGWRAGGPPPGPPSYFLPSTVSFRLLARRNLHTRLPNPGSTNAPLFFASREARANVSSRTVSICFFERVVFSARCASVADFVMVFATGGLLSIGVNVVRRALLPQANRHGYRAVKRNSPEAIKRR